MPYRILFWLYPLFFAYRIYFWDGFFDNFISISLNSLFDALSSLGGAWIIYKFERAGKSPWILFPLILLVFGLCSISLFGLHWLGYTLSEDMHGKFLNTFYSPGFQIFDIITMLLVGMSGSYASFKFQEAHQSKRRAEQILQEKKEAELQFLKSQINPHFIFNCLNSVYFSIDKTNTQAREILSNFSDLLRFQLYECSHNTISLKKEIEFIEQYIYLNEVRMQENIDIRKNMPLLNSNFEVSPLLIIPFVENAFKHLGPVGNQKAFVELNIIVKERDLLVNVKNSISNGKTKQSSIMNDNHQGIGISNVRKRLQLLYPDDHKLKIRQDHSEYEVQLKIPLV